jgi:hypothetical protein
MKYLSIPSTQRKTFTVVIIRDTKEVQIWVLLITCVSNIQFHLEDLNLFRLILINSSGFNAYWLFTDREMGRGGSIILCGFMESNVREEGKIMFNLHDFTLCDDFLEHNYHINRGIPVFFYYYYS